MQYRVLPIVVIPLHSHVRLIACCNVMLSRAVFHHIACLGTWLPILKVPELARSCDAQMSGKHFRFIFFFLAAARLQNDMEQVQFIL